MNIPFNRPYMVGTELHNIAAAHFGGQLAGDGPFTKKCHQWLEEHTGTHKALLTHSCTAALEMQSLLLDIAPGDEVIMPSFTFVSTANAVCLRGGIPVFVDIRPDTLNIDETLIEDAITPKTRAIAPVHYAGVGCEMDTIMAIAGRHDLAVIGDTAQGLMSTYKGKALGTIGDLGAVSFHETKNVISGEGGALFVNNPAYALKAEVIREKGTNRAQFFRGQVDKYTWRDIGSSYLPGEIIAAFLAAQLAEAKAITARRLTLWNTYHELLEPLEVQGVLRRPIVPPECRHNAHIYYVILADDIDRDRVLSELRAAHIGAVFHYIPLHTSPAGKRYCRTHGTMHNTEQLSARQFRLPLWVGMTLEHQEYIVEKLQSLLRK